jgi:peptidoglycan hydrolase CwlO-like protein
MRDQLKQLESQITELTGKNESLVAETSSSRTAAQQIENELRQELQASRDKYTKQIAELEKQSMDYERKAHLLSQENDTLKGRIEETEDAAKERLEVLEQQMRAEVRL